MDFLFTKLFLADFLQVSKLNIDLFLSKLHHQKHKFWRSNPKLHQTKHITLGIFLSKIFTDQISKFCLIYFYNLSDQSTNYFQKSI